MDLDRTFCTAKRCDRKESCYRWIGHLRRFQEENPDRRMKEFISTAEFSDWDGSCKMFEAMDEKTDADGWAVPYE